MLRKLSTSKRIKTQTGPIDATHEGHQYQVIDTPDRHEIISIKTYYIDVENELVALNMAVEGSETVVLKFDQLPHDFRGSDVLEAHEAARQNHEQEQEELDSKRREALEQQIKAAEAQLASLKKQAKQ